MTKQEERATEIYLENWVFQDAHLWAWVDYNGWILYPAY